MRLKCLLLLVLYFAALITQARGAAMGQMNRRNYRRLVQMHSVFLRASFSISWDGPSVCSFKTFKQEGTML